MKQNVDQYNFLAKVNHWLSAAIIIGLFAAGLWMVDLDYYSAWYQDAPHWHKSVGLMLAAYTVFRVIWKMLTSSPQIEGYSF